MLSVVTTSGSAVPTQNQNMYRKESKLGIKVWAFQHKGGMGGEGDVPPSIRKRSIKAISIQIQKGAQSKSVPSTPVKKGKL